MKSCTTSTTATAVVYAGGSYPIGWETFVCLWLTMFEKFLHNPTSCRFLRDNDNAIIDLNLSAVAAISIRNFDNNSAAAAAAAAIVWLGKLFKLHWVPSLDRHQQNLLYTVCVLGLKCFLHIVITLLLLLLRLVFIYSWQHSRILVFTFLFQEILIL